MLEERDDLGAITASSSLPQHDIVIFHPDLLLLYCYSLADDTALGRGVRLLGTDQLQIASLSVFAASVAKLDEVTPLTTPAVEIHPIVETHDW
jgi:hypothetical protein